MPWFSRLRRSRNRWAGVLAILFSLLGALPASAREGDLKEPKLDLEAAFLEAHALDLASEFPNPFQVGGVSARDVGIALNRVLHVYARRLSVVESVATSEGQRGYREVLLAETLLSGVGSEVSVSLVGDVVRDLLAEIYLAAHRLHRAQPHLDALELLSRIESLLSSSPKIDALEVLRPGSRWTFVIGEADPRGGQLQVRTALDQFKSQLTQLRELFEERTRGLRWVSDQFDGRFALDRALSVFTESDYLSGARPRAYFPLHFLALDLRSGALRTLLAPRKEQLTDVIDDFVSGRMRFRSFEESGSKPEPVLVAQGLHLLLQFPFLEFAQDESEESGPRFVSQSKSILDQSSVSQSSVKMSLRERFEEALAELYVSLTLDPARRDEFAPEIARTILGQSEGGAHNRFLRGQTHLDGLTREVLHDLPATSLCAYRGLPCFAWEGDGKAIDLPEEFPKECLISRAEFISRFTDRCWLYHGAPACAAPFREGPPISHSSHGGMAVKGCGFYTTPSFREATVYAGETGMVHPLCVKGECDLKNFKALDWERFEKTPFGIELSRVAEKLNRPPFEILSTLYGIDVCVNRYPIFQSTRALEFPKSPMDSLHKLRQAVLGRFEGDWDSLRSLETAYDHLKRSHGLAYGLGYETTEFSTWLRDWTQTQTGPLTRQRLELLRLRENNVLRQSYLASHSSWVRSIIESGDPVAMAILGRVPNIGASPFYPALMKALLSTSWEIEEEVFQEISKTTREGAEQVIEAVLHRKVKNPGFGLSRMVFASPIFLEPYLAPALEDWQSSGPENVAQILNLLTDENVIHSRQALLQRILELPRVLPADAATSPASTAQPYSTLLTLLEEYSGHQEDQGFIVGLFSLTPPPEGFTERLVELRLRALGLYRRIVGSALVGPVWDSVFDRAVEDVLSSSGGPRSTCADHFLGAFSGRPVGHLGKLAEVMLGLLSQSKLVSEKEAHYRRLLGRRFDARGVLRVLYQNGDSEIQKAMGWALRYSVTDEQTVRKLIERIIQE